MVKCLFLIQLFCSQTYQVHVIVVYKLSLAQIILGIKFQKMILQLIHILMQRYQLFLQTVCHGKSMYYNETKTVSLNPVILIIFAAFFCNILLNILIYQKRRKNEKEDKNKLIKKIRTNRVSKSLGSLLVNFFHLAISVTGSTNSTILMM